MNHEPSPSKIALRYGFVRLRIDAVLAAAVLPGIAEGASIQIEIAVALLRAQWRRTQLIRSRNPWTAFLRPSP